MSINTNLYSDGEIEEVLIKNLQEKKNVFEIPYEGGAIFHNFTDARENLLNWYPFKENSTILEIGAGMGALTGLLSKAGSRVIALEQSEKRAAIIYERYRDCDNIEVVCGNLLSFEPECRFDYITLIGVLEYVGIGSSSHDPYIDVLHKIKTMLKEDGVLLLAIENQYGLKYWCGAAEDHTSIPFDGISGYESDGYTTRYNKSGVRTFSRSALAEKLDISGFGELRWYYPLPDYKFPMAVFSDEYLPNITDIHSIKFGYPTESYLVANEKKIYEEVINNKVFPFFANSFLIECSSKELPQERILYASFKRDYKEKYRVATLINDAKQVIKKPVLLQAISHLDEIEKYTKELSAKGIRILLQKRVGDNLLQQWQEIPRADTLFKKYLSENNLTKISNFIGILQNDLLKTSGYYKSRKVKIANLYETLFEEEEVILWDGYLDMTFVNSFVDEKGLIFFDQEWKFSNVPLKFILYRAVKYAYDTRNTNISLENIYAYIGIDEGTQREFEKAEQEILKYMMDENKCKLFDPNMYHEALTFSHKIACDKEALKKKSELLEELRVKVSNQKGHIEQLLEAERQYIKKLEENRKQMVQLQNSNRELESCKTAIFRYEKEIDQYKQTICNKEGHIEQLLEVEREYEREKKSKTYKLALKFRKFSLFLMPVNSKRRFLVKVMVKAVRHPILTLKMLNPRRLKNCFTILRNEGVESAQNHYNLVEEYEKSRNVPLNNENLKVERVAEKEKELNEYAKLNFPVVDAPQVSIIIPVYNQFDYTYHCLESILKNSGECTYEILLANDCSTDLTTRIEEIIEGIRVITNESNMRFLLNCNNAAKLAKGKYILFLNNDTQVQENWLLPLVELMEKDPTIGMTGSKLLYADGYLQEAGGIMWKDASAWNYGNRQNPNDSEFNYVREVDYISGAAIMIRTSLWRKIGGFDERFVPAYCEDSDLAFEVRRHGYKVVYQPQSVVVHFEGVSNGTDVNAGQKKYQVDNQRKFHEKWKEELEKNHFENGTNVFLARDRSKDKKHVLFIDHYVPQYDKDAGSKTTFMYLKMLVSKGYHITFLGDNFYQHEPYTTELQQMGILVLYGPKYAENWKKWLKENINYFDIFYLNRPHISVKYIDFIKENAKGKIIYYGHDLHFLRIRREYELNGEQKQLEESNQWLEKELYLMRKADMNYYPSVVEEKAIHEIDASIPVKAITAYVYEQFKNIVYQFDKREGLLFVGGFGHDPNLDAVLWFLDKIYPEVYKRTKAPFYIVGSKAPEQITNIKSEGVIVKGFVPEEELQRLYQTSRLAVVPLRYGAGVKGKVVEALYYGIPVVTTSVGAEGIEGIENIAVIEDKPQELVEAICNVYTDEEQLKEMSEKSQKYVREKFSTDAVWNIIREDFE